MGHTGMLLAGIQPLIFKPVACAVRTPYYSVFVGWAPPTVTPQQFEIKIR